jgi:hypothetical protein
MSMESVLKWIPIALIVFTVLSHALAFVAQVLKDLNKAKPGWIDSASTAIGKVVDFLNGIKAPKA